MHFNVIRFERNGKRYHHKMWDWKYGSTEDNKLLQPIENIWQYIRKLLQWNWAALILYFSPRKRMSRLTFLPIFTRTSAGPTFRSSSKSSPTSIAPEPWSRKLSFLRRHTAHKEVHYFNIRYSWAKKDKMYSSQGSLDRERVSKEPELNIVSNVNTLSAKYIFIILRILYFPPHTRLGYYQLYHQHVTTGSPLSFLFFIF